jgi:hypothetical protein
MPSNDKITFTPDFQNWPNPIPLSFPGHVLKEDSTGKPSLPALEEFITKERIKFLKSCANNNVRRTMFL